MKYLSNLDMNKNQILNLVLQQLATVPSTPTKGQTYFNTTDNKAYIYNGTAWVDMTQALTGDSIVTLINASTSLIDDNNLTTTANDAITKRHSQNTDAGTSSATFYVGTSGVKLKNNSGNLQVRNNGDTAYASIDGANITANGNLNVNGNATIGDSASTDVHTINGKTTVKSGVAKASGSATTNVFEVVDSGAIPLFEVKQNGDAVIAGVLTVSAVVGAGTGGSTFTGSTTVESLTVTNDLTVNGNTFLGNDASADTTTIKGVTIIKSPVTKATGSATVDIFKIVDSADTPLFQVKQNGDTVIAGVITVNGTGTSTFAGDVNIGGHLTVQQGATVNGSLSGTDFTVEGNLVVKGNTTLGDAGSDVLTVNGTVNLPSTITIGTLSYANLSGAVTNSHAQNSDVGTSNTTFYIGGTGGVKLKNNNQNLEVYKSDGTTLADIKVNNLTVMGTTTVINSNQVDIGDNQILLNADITTNATNSNGGIAVKRLKADNTTRADAELNFNNSSGRWETVSGDVAGTLVTSQIANKVVASIGDGTATSIVVTHNLNSRAIQVSVAEKASPYSIVYPDIELTSVNTITLKFGVAPTTSQYEVTIIG